MKCLRWLVVPCLLAGLMVSLASGDAKKEPAVSTFASVLEAHFLQWDRNRDAKLSAEEIDALIANPRVTGDEAAAVASIHLHFRKNPTSAPITKQFVLQPPGKDVSDRRDVIGKSVNFAGGFPGFREHIRKAPRQILGEPNVPSLEGFHQGAIGDCYFLAAVASAIHADAAAFRKMFQPRPDGSCDVHFYSGHTVHVPKLTDAQIALTSNAGEQGLWMNVGEMAYADFRVQIQRTKKKDKADLNLDVLGRGGSPADAIRALSGSEAKQLDIRHKQDPPAANDIPHLTGQLHSLFSTGISRRFLFCTSVGKGTSPPPPGIITDHAYAILGYQAKTQVVTVMNPWGNEFKPKGSPGLANGYLTHAGKFDVSLHDFVLIFDAVYYQTQLPAKKP